jgi:cell shape-determining protein MreC
MSAPARSNEKKRSNLGMLPVCLVACWLVSMVPDRWQTSARSALLDSTVPIHSARTWITEFSRNNKTNDQKSVADLQSELQQQQMHYEHVLRQKDLQLVAALNAKSDRQAAILSPFNVSDRQSILHSEVVAAEVVSLAQQTMLHKQMLIKSSSANDLQTDQLVLVPVEESKSLVVNQGDLAGLSESLPVFAGQCVVGTLTAVGKQVSRVRLLTDPDYRSRARILRKVNESWAYGPEGVFEGTGQGLCKLTYIGKTESVRVGDEVYTVDPITSSSAPMYFGRIEKAELEPDAHEWTVWVRPAFDLDSLSDVQILKQSLSRNRILAN